ncbi:MAG: TraR/DksA family transcriptional regulator [Planctomycetota bacterium]
MEKKKINESELTPAEIAKIKVLLLEKRNEILGNVISMEDETLRRQRSDLSNTPIHMADIGTDNFDLENTLHLVESERKILTAIDDALGRIEEGTYGICEGSGEPIPKERLEAIPWARYCVAYASRLEKGIVDKEKHFDETDSEDKPDEEQDDNLYPAEE